MNWFPKLLSSLSWFLDEVNIYFQDFKIINSLFFEWRSYNPMALRTNPSWMSQFSSNYPIVSVAECFVWFMPLERTEETDQRPKNCMGGLKGILVYWIITKNKREANKNDIVRWLNGSTRTLALS